MNLTPNIIDFVCHNTGADKITSTQDVQSLWSGYGSITRIQLQGAPESSVVIKMIAPPSVGSHPRGWNTDYSHQRKLKSYQVESHWYTDFLVDSQRLPRLIKPVSWFRLPRCIAALRDEDVTCLILEDLDVEFPVRKQFLDLSGAKVCLQWLARFHAEFMCVEPVGLWPIGTYWHLETRPDEFQKMVDGPIKQSAEQLDRMLASCQYQTLVHGDAKVANFCFSENGETVSAVDFQYVGGGCGIKDVVYFIGSCMSEESCHAYESVLLDDYFDTLYQCLQGGDYADVADKICHEWRSLYAVAWTDFYRFLLGWMPEHQKINGYTQLMAERALQELGFE